MIKKTFVSVLLVSTILSSVAIAAETRLNKEGDVTLTIRGNYVKRSKTINDTNFTASVNKRNSYGAGIEANYYVTPNMSVIAAVDYQNFGSKNAFITGNTGPTYGFSSRYIPIRAGVLFHLNDFSGFRPYIGGGYEFVNVKHKVHLANSTYDVTAKGKNSHGGYIQAGTNYFTPDGGVAFNFDVKKSIGGRNTGIASVRDTTIIREHKIKYSPLTFGIGVTIATND